MHYHLEIVIPPTEDIEKAISEIMTPFDENGEDSDHAFWDFYSIGGRWAGNKTKSKLDPEKLKSFYDWMKSENVMVKGFTCGKEELANKETEEKVDAKWREIFPEAGNKCLLFKHSNNQYDEFLDGDICPISEVPDNFECERIIFASKHDNKYQADCMIQTEYWNGVSLNKTVWDGHFDNAIKIMNEEYSYYKDEYRKEKTPKSDWLVVTVDYHS